eukprot:3721016-Pleurochrysis_carterae.AAC.1
MSLRNGGPPKKRMCACACVCTRRCWCATSDSCGGQMRRFLDARAAGTSRATSTEEIASGIEVPAARI